MSSIPKKRVYNLVRQDDDQRDYSAAPLVNKYKGLELPKSADLRQYCPPVYTQQIGDCTANVAVAAFYMLLNTPKT